MKKTENRSEEPENTKDESSNPISPSLSTFLVLLEDALEAAYELDLNYAEILGCLEATKAIVVRNMYLSADESRVDELSQELDESVGKPDSLNQEEDDEN